MIHVSWSQRFRFQELNQADISVLRKAEVKEKLNTIRKAFDKDIKEKEAALNKLVRAAGGDDSVFADWSAIKGDR